MVMATSLRAAASCGRRVQFGPSSELRGSRPADEMTAWFATSAPSDQGHRCGFTAVVTIAPACTAIEAFHNIE